MQTVWILKDILRKLWSSPGCITVTHIKTDPEYFKIEGSGNDAKITAIKESKNKIVTFSFSAVVECDHIDYKGNTSISGSVTDYPLNFQIWDYNEGSDNPSDEPNSPAPCNHFYEAEVIKEATATQDGEEVLRCKYCGEVQSDSKISITGYSIFSKDTIKAIQNAAKKEVIAETDRWESFPVKVLQVISDKKDVSLTIRYKHLGNSYTLTIPPGADLSPLIKDNLFIGFRYLDSMFGGSQILK